MLFNYLFVVFYNYLYSFTSNYDKNKLLNSFSDTKRDQYTHIYIYIYIYIEREREREREYKNLRKYLTFII